MNAAASALRRLPVTLHPDWSVHCCLVDRDCWQLHYIVPVPHYLYLFFLQYRDGSPVRIPLSRGTDSRSRYWQWRRRRAWEAMHRSLDEQRAQEPTHP